MAYGICSLGLSLVVGIPGSKSLTRLISYFFYSDLDAEPLYSIQSLKCFCTAALSSDDHHDDTTTKRSRKSHSIINYGDN